MTQLAGFFSTWPGDVAPALVQLTPMTDGCSKPFHGLERSPSRGCAGRDAETRCRPLPAILRLPSTPSSRSSNLYPPIVSHRNSARCMDLQMERCVELGDSPTWRTFPALKYEGEKHPVSRALTDRLDRLQESIARATALRLGGDRSDLRVLTTRLPLAGQQRIQPLHRSADWVITADRNVCIEYFDSPRDARTVYDAYIIDCVPERNDLGCLQLVTSTCNIEEVRDLFDEMLGQMGLSSTAQNCEFVLWHLKGLSGRLAIRLASPATKSGELVALALVHAHCVEALGHDPVWLPLTDIFLVLNCRLQLEWRGRSLRVARRN